MVVESPAIVVFGAVATVAVFVIVRWDAIRTGISRPQVWAAVAAVPVLVGVSMSLFATVPTTGIIMTANTGLVLYTFEREVVTEDDEPAEPGQLPHRSVDGTHSPEAPSRSGSSRGDDGSEE
ncbi:hypothetical protein [Natrialba swarupiae]|uniref:hypothetical protein n=1 Tax=Natrialba swarupiae TaxID=2448032 RepID=UPI001EE455E6|nr:hypothetical protein [Natrialba swarupiae]